MDSRQFDAVAKAAAAGISRRKVLRGLLAVAGGGALVHRTGGESDARLGRCCRREKRFLKRFCSALSGGTCPNVINFSCQKTGPGECEVMDNGECATTEGVSCF